MTSVTDNKPTTETSTTKAPLMNEPFIAFNFVKGEETVVHETWIELGWNRFKWLEARKDKSFVTSTGFTFQVGEESYQTKARILGFSHPKPSKCAMVIPDIRREFGELCAAWQLDQTGVQGNTVPMVSESILSLTKTQPPKDKIQLYTSHPLGQDFKFKASNGVTILIGRWADMYSGDKKLYVTTTSNVTTITPSFNSYSGLMEDWELVQVALREFDETYSHVVKSGDFDFSEWTYPGIVNTDPSSVKPVVPVHMTTELFKYTQKKHKCPSDRDGRFTATNGIIINCWNTCTPGYQNGAPNSLFINSDILNKDWTPSPTKGFAEYIRDSAKIQAAFKELEERFAQYKSAKAKTKVPIHISKEVYDYAKKHCSEFKARNGITIKCSDHFTPGFENPNPDTLYVDNRVSGTDWIPGKNRGRKAYVAKMDRVQAAISELKAKQGEHEKAKAEKIEAPVAARVVAATATIAVPDVSAPIPVVSKPPSNVSMFTENITQLTSMGFTREQAIRGLVMSGNDVVEAVKKLLSSA